MSIVVIDMSPELFWYVSGALGSLELPIKHFPDSNQAAKIVISELPDIVILNGDDSSIHVSEFIGKMRNHVFARNTLFIVFTSDPSLEFRRQLVVQGAAQVFYRHGAMNPDPKTFINTVTWLMELNKNKPHKFEQPYFPFAHDGELTSWGRMGWISESQCLIETNVDLNPGETISLTCSLFEDLGIKEPKFTCVEKNKVGRYYQYANTFLGRITSKHTEQDVKKLRAWINDNKEISKNKPVKIVFYEPDSKYREEITNMIKLDRRYCARGYKDIDDFENSLNFQHPTLILINRLLIQKRKQQFDAIKKFTKNNFCFCITYALDEMLDINEFKKNYEFAMHVDKPVDEKLLESMIGRLELKILKDTLPADKVMFNKHSAYSRIALHIPIKLTDISHDGVQIRSPFFLSPYCSLEISSASFYSAKLGRLQLFRVIEARKTSKNGEGTLHKLIYIGHTFKERDIVEEVITSIKESEEFKPAKKS